MRELDPAGIKSGHLGDRKLHHSDEAILSHKLRMLQPASCYNLADRAERARSVADLENFFFRIMGHVQPAVFIEAGAKNAKVSARARKRLPDSKIVAFEANPHSYNIYKDAKYIHASNIDYIHAALASEVGEIEFSLQAETDGVPNSKTRGNGSILIPNSDSVKLETHKVKATTLDTHFASKDMLNAFIWVDVEGAQSVVLPGGDRIFREQIGCAFVEVEDREFWTGQWVSNDTHKFMLERGLVPIIRDFQSRYQYNVIYMRENILNIDYIAFCLQMYHSHTMAGREA